MSRSWILVIVTLLVVLVGFGVYLTISKTSLFSKSYQSKGLPSYVQRPEPTSFPSQQLLKKIFIADRPGFLLEGTIEKIVVESQYKLTTLSVRLDSNDFVIMDVQLGLPNYQLFLRTRNTKDSTKLDGKTLKTSEIVPKLAVSQKVRIEIAFPVEGFAEFEQKLINYKQPDRMVVPSGSVMSLTIL